MKERFGFGNCLYFGHLAIDILPAILFYYKNRVDLIRIRVAKLIINIPSDMCIAG